MNVLIVFSFLFAIVFGNPTLELYAAGMRGKFIKELQTGDKICPENFERGFSIKCNSEGDPWAKFYVDGRLARKDMFSPFFITGRGKRFVKAWQGYPELGSDFTVTCYSNSGAVAVALTMACANTANCDYELEDPTDPVGTLYYKEASSSANKKIKLASGKTFCPQDAFQSNDITIESKADKSNMAYFFVDGDLEYLAKDKPFYIAGTNGNSPKAWNYKTNKAYTIDVFLPNSGTYRSVKNVKISCASRCEDNSPINSEPPSPTPTSTSSPKPDNPGNPAPAGCIIIDAKTADLSTGWSELSDGVGYRVSDPSMDTSSSGQAPLHFPFKVPSNSYYAVVLDFTTNSTFYFNDLWIQMSSPGLGLNLFRNTIVTTDWVKVYHNENGRAVLTWTQGDLFVKRTISSGAVLKPNVNYVLSVGGRSAQVVLHRVLLFPCQKTSAYNRCQYQKWEQDQNRCIPGSYVPGA